ncbi:hypothetical protein VNO77_12497 [Canavalia gladiata]|uniref:Uncharacterized protein n=1 Tax=Canavalia gladiata TaxID=3824 RepID=A0AAN9M1L6_CANGL
MGILTRPLDFECQFGATGSAISPSHFQSILLLPHLLQAILTTGLLAKATVYLCSTPIAEKGAFTPSCVYCIFWGVTPTLSTLELEHITTHS